jgi:hypothetical protein
MLFLGTREINKMQQFMKLKFQDCQPLPPLCNFTNLVYSLKTVRVILGSSEACALYRPTLR